MWAKMMIFIIAFPFWPHGENIERAEKSFAWVYSSRTWHEWRLEVSLYFRVACWWNRCDAGSFISFIQLQDAGSLGLILLLTTLSVFVLAFIEVLTKRDCQRWRCVCVEYVGGKIVKLNTENDWVVRADTIGWVQPRRLDRDRNNKASIWWKTVWRASDWG